MHGFAQWGHTSALSAIFAPLVKLRQISENEITSLNNKIKKTHRATFVIFFLGKSLHMFFTGNLILQDLSVYAPSDATSTWAPIVDVSP